MLNSRRDIALNASLDAMSIAVAKPVKVQNWGSHNASTVDKEPLYATQGLGIARHDDGRDIKDLLKSRSHGRAEAVHN